MFPKPKKAKQRSKTAYRNKKYLELNREFLSDYPWCQVRTCDKQSEVVHHIKGRGKHLLEQDTWLAVCNNCHLVIHDQPTWAKEQGYMEGRA